MSQILRQISNNICFIANWQNKELENLKSKVTRVDLLCLLDLAQKNATLYQDLIKSAYYAKL